MFLVSLLLMPSVLNRGETAVQPIEKAIEQPVVAQKIEPKTEQWITAEVTMYSAGDGNTPGVIMASGKHVYEGAAAYNGLVLGSVIEIDGRRYVVEDRCKYDGVVDLYSSSISRAYDWGRQWRKVKVIKEGN